VKLRDLVLPLYAAAAVIVAACAHVEQPPGGEQDTEAPLLETTRPDTFATLRSYLGPVVFAFNEGLSEKGIDTVVTVSPRTSAVAVDKSGSQVRVSLRRGWEPNRVYQVTLHPGIRDLFGNATKEPLSVVFSTGAEIVRTRATGTVIERTTLAPARNARIEAVHQPDSVLYETRPDSAGNWVIEYLPVGTYRVRAYTDTNADQELQAYEAQDTTTITVTRADTARARRLALIAPDTTAPKAGTASGERDLIEVRFDDYLDPVQPLSAANVTVTGPNNAAVPVSIVRVGPFPAAGDSAGADSTARDSGRVAARPAQRDTGRAAPARPTEPVPSQSLFIRTAQPLAADAQYTVVVRNVRNLLGLVGGGSVELRSARAPAQPARADSAGAARRDSTAARAPAAGTPRPAPARPRSSPAPVAAPPRPRR